MCHEAHTCLHSSVQLQSLAVGGTKMVSNSPGAYSLKVDLNGTPATSEGLSLFQLANAQKKLMPIVYLLVALLVFIRCTALYSHGKWFYKRKIVKTKMKNVKIQHCASQTNSSAPEQKQLMQTKRAEDESDADETSPAEPHASTENAHDKALMRSVSMILAFQILATILSLCLGLEMIIHYAEVYPSAFAEPFATVCLCLWVVALLLLLIIATCYTCIQHCRHDYWYLSLCGNCCMKCLLCCVMDLVACHLTVLFSSIVDIVLTIGTIHFLAYVTSVSILFLLASFLRNWLLTFYIVVTNVSCFIILLVALSEVAYLFLKVKLDKPAPGSKKCKCLMAVFHRTAVVFLFIALSAAMCVIYLQPNVLNNHLSTSPMFTPVVTMAATITVIYILMRRYHIFPFNKDAKEYITT